MFLHFKKCLALFFCLQVFLIIYAQKDLPEDYLSKEFHKGRRDAARALMPDNSVMVVFAAPTRTFSNDVEYLYHQNPDMYYFTGYKEPDAVLFIFKDVQTDSAGNRYNELFFVQKKDAASEQWTGRRLGPEGVRKNLGIETVYNGEDFRKVAINFEKFDKIILDNMPDDVVRRAGPASLYSLMTSFKQRAKFDPALNSLLESFKRPFPLNRLNSLQDNLKNRFQTNPEFASHPLVQGFLDVKDSLQLVSYRERLDKNKYSVTAFREITGKLREIKTPEELALLRKAVEISCIGQNEVMKLLKPDMSELEVQGLHEYVHKKYGAEGVGYGSIIGAGENGCILHYMENSKTKIGNNLLLMDVGAEYHGYTADVTRTIPAKGKFSAEERAIYQLVYDAQEAAFKILKDGAKFSDANLASREVIANGLIRLGIIKDKSEVGKYYPHGLGHHIGLDVHDRSYSPTLKKGMVMSVEPGIYIPENSPVDKKWWGIGVRIEDNALITEKGYELLSTFAPRKIEDIEKMMAEKSGLENYKLPPLQSGKKKPI